MRQNRRKQRCGSSFNFCGLQLILCLNCKGHAANRALGVQAADLLLSTRHLLAMSSLPVRCYICCICLEYLLLEGRDAGMAEKQEERGSETREEASENEERVVQMPGGGRGKEGSTRGNHAQREDQKEARRGSEAIMMDVANSRALLPPTLTQVYLTGLTAFLSRDPDKRRRKDMPKTVTPQQRWRLSRVLNILTLFHTTDSTCIT